MTLLWIVLLPLTPDCIMPGHFFIARTRTVINSLIRTQRQVCSLSREPALERVARGRISHSKFVPLYAMCMVYEYLYVYTHARDNARTRAHTHKHTQVKRLSKFAMNIGLAFQIIDDM